MYEHNPPTIEELREAVRVKVVQIDREMWERVEANFQERLEKCFAENGRHLENIIFKH